MSATGSITAPRRAAAGDVPLDVAGQYFEWTAALAGTLLSLYWHWVNLQGSGGLWRDEAHSATLARLPAIGEIWKALSFDSFPILSTLALRAWSATAWGASDVGLRWFGLLVGAAILAALWLNAWRTARVPPTLSVLLWGLAPMSIHFGDAIRPHGFGILTMLVAWGLVWQVVRRPSPLNASLASLAAVAAVQSLYQNAFFVLVVVSSGVLITAIERRWRAAALVLAIGALAALSLLPYLPSIRAAREWAPVARTHADDLAYVCRRLIAVLRNAGVYYAAVWLVSSAAAVALVAAQVIRRDGRCGAWPLGLYGLSTITVGGACQLVLLGQAGVMTQPWHYLLTLALAATALDALLGPPPAFAWLRAAALVIGACLLWPLDAEFLRRDHTNIDKIAGYLNENAGPRDLVVVAPWYHGVTFHRYYHGEAPWTTLPPFREIKLHRYDELKRLMQSPQAHVPVLNQVSATLKRGGRVWTLGDFPFLQPGQHVPPWPRVPDPATGWDSEPHLKYWMYVTGDYLQRHAAERTMVVLDDTVATGRLERTDLWISSGWRD